jgi:hypothetical protein
MTARAGKYATRMSTTLTTTNAAVPADSASPTAPPRPPVLPGALRPIRRLLTRPYSPLGPTVLYALIAAGMLYPFWSPAFRSAGDLFVVMGVIVEADNALAEGQFPIRVAPRQHDGARYPFFQFYGNFPFTLTAAASRVLPGHDPYLAWKAVSWLMLVVGAAYTWRLCRRLTRHHLASVLAGVVFMTAPYMFADFVGRGAFTEFFGFNLLPAVAYHAWRAFASPGARHVCASAIAWGLLGLSHNITYLYAVTFLGLWFLSYFSPRRRYAWRLGRATLAGLVHFSLVVWYIVPQLAMKDALLAGSNTQFPIVWNFMSPLRVLLWPVAMTPERSNTLYLTPQVGIPVLLSGVLGLATLFVPRLGWRRRGVAARAVVMFAVAFLLAWSPVDVWPYLPKLYSFVQFPYRLLAFVTFAGAIACACAFAWLAPVRRWQVAPVLLLVGAWAGTYVPRDHQYSGADAIPSQFRDPRIGAVEDYLMTTQAVVATSLPHPPANLVGTQFGVAVPGGRVERHATVTVPTPQGPRPLHVEGYLDPRDAQSANLAFNLADRRHDFPIEAGPFALELPTPEPYQGRPARLTIAPEVAPRVNQWVPVRMDGVAFEPDEPRPGDRVAVPAEQVRRSTVYGLRTRSTVSLAQPAVVSFPVLYYPGAMRVLLNGADVRPGNVGRFLALELGPGRHTIDVTFTGSRWANAVSLLGWCGVLAFPWLDRRRRRRSARGGPARFTMFDAILGTAAVVAGVLFTWNFPRLVHYLQTKVHTTVTASASVGAEQGPEFAFDNDPATIWAVPPSTPTTLTIKPEKRAQLDGIELESRETSLWEAWHTVRVVLHRKGVISFDQTFTFPDAASKPIQTIPLTGTATTDLVELHFSDPVRHTKDGRMVDPALVSPGYREIRLRWVEKDD